jgi:OOP family OmpA-OmpF porin
MRTPFVFSVISTALISVGAVNAQAADGYFYDPSNVGAGVYKPETKHASDAMGVPATTGHEINRTVGCPGRGILDKPCGIEDADKDKVEDWTDKCPDTPAGRTVNKLGCEIDSDGDGVFDGADKCPGTPPGRKVNVDGCEPDTDGDGVVDADDKCPTVYAKTADGCPLPEAAAPAAEAAPAAGAPIMSFEDVLFDFDKATLRPTADAKIDQAVAYVLEHNAEKFDLRGYADSTGPEAYNLKLSQRRADVVRNAMIKKGAPADRLNATGYGEADPVGDNATKEGRAQNRRVEMHSGK